MQFIPYKIRSNQPHFVARALTLVHALSMCVFLVHAVHRGEYTGLRSTKLQDPHGKGDGRRRPARIALHSNSPPTSKERLGGRWSDCLIDENRHTCHSCAHPPACSLVASFRPEKSQTIPTASRPPFLTEGGKINYKAFYILSLDPAFIVSHLSSIHAREGSPKPCSILRTAFKLRETHSLAEGLLNAPQMPGANVGCLDNCQGKEVSHGSRAMAVNKNGTKLMCYEKRCGSMTQHPGSAMVRVALLMRVGMLAFMFMVMIMTMTGFALARLMSALFIALPGRAIMPFHNSQSGNRDHAWRRNTA